MKLFTIYDKVSKLYGEPHTFVNSQVAMRDISNTVNSPDCENIPFSDLELFYIGEFDQSKCRFHPDKFRICCLSDLKREEVNSNSEHNSVQSE